MCNQTVPATSTRDVTMNLKSKFNRNFRVEQLQTKYDHYASLKVTEPMVFKKDVLNKDDWNDRYMFVKLFMKRTFLDVYMLYSEFSVLCRPFNLQVTTFNCHGMKTSTDTTNIMCNESQIILLQEHWLYPDELQLISQLNPNFQALDYPLCVLTTN